jgi:N-glycosylase/DNA lyase
VKLVTEQNWRRVVWRTLRGLDWQNVMNDVRPFLESSRDAELLTRENLERLLRGTSER